MDRIQAFADRNTAQLGLTVEALIPGPEFALDGLPGASGPVHAEMRVNDHGIWLLEVAARSNGGVCGRALDHRLGTSLEQLILRHALRLCRAEAALRAAHANLAIEVRADLPMTWACAQ